MPMSTAHARKQRRPAPLTTQRYQRRQAALTHTIVLVTANVELHVAHPSSPLLLPTKECFLSTDARNTSMHQPHAPLPTSCSVSPMPGALCPDITPAKGIHTSVQCQCTPHRIPKPMHCAWRLEIPRTTQPWRKCPAHAHAQSPPHKPCVRVHTHVFQSVTCRPSPLVVDP